MPKIEVPDSMVPEGWDVDDATPIQLRSHAVGFETGNYIVTYIPLRRKPRLKQIVFTVAGEPRLIQPNEWFLTSGGQVLLASRNGFDEVRTPLHREEVYE